MTRYSLERKAVVPGVTANTLDTRAKRLENVGVVDREDELFSSLNLGEQPFEQSLGQGEGRPGRPVEEVANRAEVLCGRLVAVELCDSRRAVDFEQGLDQALEMRNTGRLKTQVK